MEEFVQANYCPSCNTKLNDNTNFCPNCGQSRKTLRTGIFNLIQEFFGDYLAFDSKLFKTLKPLVTNPGFLTNEFIKQKRSLYVPPLRMYLFVSFVYFLFASFIAHFTEPEIISVSNTKTNTESPIQISLQADSSTYYHKLDSLLSLDPEKVPDDEYVEARLLQGVARLVTLPGEKRDDLLRSNTPVVLLILIPLFAFLSLLLNYNKPLFYVDHVVFMSHVLSLALIAALILLPVSLFLHKALAQFIWFLCVAAYFCIAFKRVMQTSQAKAVLWGGIQLLLFTTIFGVGLFIMILYIVYFEV